MYSIIEEITKKSVIVLSLIFLSGCSTFDIVTTAIQVVDITEEKNATVKPTKVIPKHNWNKPKPKVVDDKPKHNWNKPEPVVVEPPKPKEERQFPWWALILAIVSGTSYFINTKKHNNKR